MGKIVNAISVVFWSSLKIGQAGCVGKNSASETEARRL